MFGMGRACYRRTYVTKHTLKEIIDWFNTKNIYDVFSYDYYETPMESYIVFKQYMKGFIGGNWNLRGNLNSKYDIVFTTTSDGLTSFEISFCKKLPSFPWLTDKQLDEFFFQKVDAYPVK